MSNASTTTTPFIALTPTRKRVNPSTYEGGDNLYVTANEKGALRAAQGFVLDLAVGDVIEAKHSKRGGSYGPLTVVGIVSDGVKYGEVPEANVPLRLVG